MEEQRRLLAELMGSASGAPASTEADDYGPVSRSASPEPQGGNREREFDAASIYGDHDGDDDDDGGTAGPGSGAACKGAAEGWGPPMANVLVTGLPWGKEHRASIKAKLRAEAERHGAVVGVTWGNRKGTCFLGMAAPVDASRVILKLHDQACLFPGLGKKILKLKLDRDQGRPRPDPPAASERYANEVRFAGGPGGEDAMPPVSFTSRQGRISEQLEVAREQRWLQDTLCWCSICDSREHTDKSCSVDVPQYHERVVLGYIPAGAPVDDQGLIFGPLPPAFEAKKAALAAAEAGAVQVQAAAQVQLAVGGGGAKKTAMTPAAATALAALSAKLNAKVAAAAPPPPLVSASSLSSYAPGADPLDWVCSFCNNDNWARRTSCNRCGADREAAAAAEAPAEQVYAPVGQAYEPPRLPPPLLPPALPLPGGGYPPSLAPPPLPPPGGAPHWPSDGCYYAPAPQQNHHHHQDNSGGGGYYSAPPPRGYPGQQGPKRGLPPPAGYGPPEGYEPRYDPRQRY